MWWIMYTYLQPLTLQGRAYFLFHYSNSKNKREIWNSRKVTRSRWRKLYTVPSEQRSKSVQEGFLKILFFSMLFLFAYKKWLQVWSKLYWLKQPGSIISLLAAIWLQKNNNWVLENEKYIRILEVFASTIRRDYCGRDDIMDTFFFAEHVIEVILSAEYGI